MRPLLANGAHNGVAPVDGIVKAEADELEDEAPQRFMNVVSGLGTLPSGMGTDIFSHDTIRLSDDILTHLAEILPEDGMQRTLAALNLSSPAVHEATLPILYRKLQFKEEEFEYVAGYDVPKCLRYTRPKTDLSLETDDEAPNEDYMRTMEIVLDMITDATDPEERRPLMETVAKKKGLIVTCRPRVFEAFIRVLQSREPLLLAMQVDLKGQTTTAIGTNPSDLRKELARYASKAKQYLAGQLDMEKRVDAEPLEGNPLFEFHSQVLEGYAYSSEELLEDGDLGAVCSYPSADAPMVGMERLLESDLDEEDDSDEEDDKDYDDEY
ncbi:hypothetical protein QFC20_006105 [Naganishia adeliensis]|uniref:Uncharacterized protein n=1 Tax=Naganishia adeliensis TaxID=92952 RepID=A0ACC2VEY3_9TREE|nr:hypothetical protein QFC20_006105 [Naganishia adeliensis]